MVSPSKGSSSRTPTPPRRRRCRPTPRASRASTPTTTARGPTPTTGSTKRANGRETLVVVVADHSESLGEKDEWTHAHLVHEATLKIPLLMHAPAGLPSGLHIDTRVSQVDLVPTLARLLGVAVPEDLDGVDLTEPPDTERALLAEAVDGEVNFGWGRLTALYKGGYKFVEGQRPELYDLRRDSLERDDLAASDAETVKALRRELRGAYGAGGNALARPTAQLDAADVARLDALGYVVATSRLRSRLPVHRHPVRGGRADRGGRRGPHADARRAKPGARQDPLKQRGQRDSLLISKRST